MTTLAEENYLKAIYKIHEQKGGVVSTSAIAAALDINAASVTDFIKKMAGRKLISYEKSKGVLLTATGKQAALSIIRKHRLWEVWLVEKLGFSWDQVHDIAEQLEHIDSDELIDHLAEHLGHPTADPHGDPIPDAKGKLAKTGSKPMLNCSKGDKVKFVGVAEHSNSFLQYLTKANLKLGDELLVESIEDFDRSFHVKVNRKERKVLSKEVVKNLLVVGY